ncbi:MAG: DUF4345 domain-containing protein [Pseudomonadota bacterium]
MQSRTEVTVFRSIVAVLALIPISAGAAGVFYGLSFPGFDVVSQNANASSHFRFLSGIFLAIGVAYWTVALAMGDWLRRFQLLAVLTVVGGLARGLSIFADGTPSTGHQMGLFMELGVAPLLLFRSTRLHFQQIKNL